MPLDIITVGTDSTDLCETIIVCSFQGRKEGQNGKYAGIKHGL